MLQLQLASEREPPSSPRRLTQPFIGEAPADHTVTRSASGARNKGGRAGTGSEGGGESVESGTGSAHGIQRDAFSPNYFERFFAVESELGRGGKGVVLLVRHELDGVPLGKHALSPYCHCNVALCKSIS